MPSRGNRHCARRGGDRRDRGRLHHAGPGQPSEFTVSLRPGTYHVVNYQDLVEGAPLLVLNEMPQLGEAVFMRVADDTTVAQLQEFFDAANRED